MSPRPDTRLGPEFSRPFSVEALGQIRGDDEAVERIEATEAERDAVARRLGLVALDRLAADLRLRRTRDGSVIRVTGHLEAEVTQICVVSLQPLRSRVSEDFTALYTSVPAGGEASGRGECDTVEVEALGEDPPETLGRDGLDLGETVVQQLALVLEPYPRDQGASLEALGWRGNSDEDAAGKSPFKGLKALIRGR